MKLGTFQLLLEPLVLWERRSKIGSERWRRLVLFSSKDCTLETAKTSKRPGTLNIMESTVWNCRTIVYLLWLARVSKQWLWRWQWHWQRQCHWQWHWKLHWHWHWLTVKVIMIIWCSQLNTNWHDWLLHWPTSYLAQVPLDLGSWRNRIDKASNTVNSTV